MATANEKLAASLATLKQIQARGSSVINVSAHPALTRAHRERLVRAGFLRPVTKGWYLPGDPAAGSGDSTQWFAHMEVFAAAYANARFGTRWQLSPEMSLLRQSGHTAVFKQMQIHAPEASNQILELAHGCSIFLYKITNQSLSGNAVVDAQGLRILPAEEAVVRAGPSFFTLHPLAAQIIMRRIDLSLVSRVLLEGESAVVAGRMASALEAVGRAGAATQLRATIKTAGIGVSTQSTAQNPFAAQLPDLGGSVKESPYVQRIRAMWVAMRGEVIAQFTTLRVRRPRSVAAIIKDIEARYTADAYHSLSIEGYKVSDELIERVKSGDWNPVSNAKDQDFRDAMAAKGYLEAHTKVVALIRQTLTSGSAPGAALGTVPPASAASAPGIALQRDFPNWFPALFSSNVAAGILRPADLAGYRNSQVFIRNAQHVPLAPQAVRDCMPALFDLIAGETHPGARALLGHFIFVFIHPYMDGNGRLGRFLMNYLLATGGHRWVIVPVQRRTVYMAALEQASTHGNIKPFARLIAGLMEEQGTETGKRVASAHSRRPAA